MPRKPKTQPSPDDTAPVPEPDAPDEAPAPARRGRKPKVAALSFASPAAADAGSPATDGAGADAPGAAPIKMPGRKGQSRKPKQAAGVETAPSLRRDATESQGQAPGQPAAKASMDLTEADAPAAAAASQPEAAADNDPVQRDRDPTGLADEAAQPSSEADASTPAKSAVHWNHTTDRVQFDWPEIERVAAQGGPNQAMAKLLVAARAEGARSRWPF